MILPILFWTFFKIGLFTFGGGYAMLPLIQEQVLAHGWATEAEIINYVAVSESTPGPFAINMATYVGMETGGFLGALCATLGVVLPSFIVILIVARVYAAFRTNRIVQGCMSGLKPAVIGLIAAAAISIAKTVFFGSTITAAVLTAWPFWFSLGLFAVCLLLALKKLHPIAVIGVAAGAGIAAGYLFELPV